jgi:ribonuclease BN (tRNA processing enzyme)
VAQPSENNIRVTVLGSGTCVPSLARSSCSILLQVGETQMVFDAGPGTMRRLLEAGTDIYRIDYVFFSHFHPDHTAELVPFLFANKYPDPLRRRRPLTLVGGPGLRQFVAGLEGVYGHWIQLAPDRIDLVEMDGSRALGMAGAGLTVTAAPVVHNPESVAFRIETASGCAVVYSGDTDYSERLVASGATGWIVDLRSGGAGRPKNTRPSDTLAGGGNGRPGGRPAADADPFLSRLR